MGSPLIKPKKNDLFMLLVLIWCKTSLTTNKEPFLNCTVLCISVIKCFTNFFGGCISQHRSVCVFAVKTSEAKQRFKSSYKPHQPPAFADIYTICCPFHLFNAGQVSKATSSSPVQWMSLNWRQTEAKTHFCSAGGSRAVMLWVPVL